MGWAYLADGTRVDYKDYISKHPHWQKVRKTRFEFDGGRCVICQRDLRGEAYHTHHLSYQLLGRERIRDVITLCESCHTEFHKNWEQPRFWKGKGGGHWDIYNLDHTASLCAHYWMDDRFISKNPDGLNLCNEEVCGQLIDDYVKVFGLATVPVIDPHDISLYVRNKRYEILMDAYDRGLTLEQFLDEYFGPKVRGKNPLRQEAGKKNGPFDHTPAKARQHYYENKNILILMEKVNNIIGG